MQGRNVIINLSSSGTQLVKGTYNT